MIQHATDNDRSIRIRPSFRSFWRTWLVSATLAWLVYIVLPRAVASHPSFQLPYYFNAAAVAGVFLIATTLVQFRRRHYLFEIVQGDLIRARSGVIARVSREFSISDGIQTDVEQSPMGRILGFGDVHFWCANDRSKLSWIGIARPQHLANIVRERVRHITPSSQTTARTSKLETTTAAPSIELPTLREAQKTKKTHFGRSAEAINLSTQPRLRVRCLHHNCIDNRDGTISLANRNLMCIRAPWGMAWTGEAFVGMPILLDWHSATNLFGRGSFASYPLWFKDLSRVKRSRHFKRGRCRVTFAGFDDWRLATAEEFYAFVPPLFTISHGMVKRELGSKDDFFAKQEAMQLELEAHLWKDRHLPPSLSALFPELSNRLLRFWTANHAGDCAWAYVGDCDTSFCDVKPYHEMEVLLVRDGNGTEYAGRQVEDASLESTLST